MYVPPKMAMAPLSWYRPPPPAVPPLPLKLPTAPLPPTALLLTSVMVWIVTLALVYRRRYELARYGAALAVAAIIAGWALARWPALLPGLTVYGAAAGHDTLVALVVAVLAGGAILFPALALLFRLALSGRFRAVESVPSEFVAEERAVVKPQLLARWAAAMLIAGFGLLNVADARWAHGVGLGCLLAFLVLAFCAIVLPALEQGSGTDLP